MIAANLNPVYVSKMLGHASPSITLDRYAHLWAKAAHEETAVEALDGIAEKAGLGKSWENSGSERRQTEALEEPQKVAVLRDSASGR
jgi:hypothetical protein